MLLDAHGIRAYVDGFGLDVYEILKKSPEYLRNPEILERAFIRVVPVKSSRVRLYKDLKSKILFTGYLVEGTNGSWLFNV